MSVFLVSSRNDSGSIPNQAASFGGLLKEISILYKNRFFNFWENIPKSSESKGIFGIGYM